MFLMIRRPMNRFPTFCKLALLGAMAPLALVGRDAPGFVYETETEFQALADVDGDGFQDFVVVDKATGQFRVAAGAGDGSLTWRTNPGDSGLGRVTGFSAGPIVKPDRDALLFVDPLANRIQLVDTPEDMRLTEPVRIPAEFVGPSLVTAINLPVGPSGYDPEFYDIVYQATLHDPSYESVVGNLRNEGSGPPFVESGQFAMGEAPRRPNRILLEEGGDDVYGVLEDTGAASAFSLYDPLQSPIQRFSRVVGLPDEVSYVFADFDDDGMAQFVFFTPGSNTIYESRWDGSQLTALTSFDYSQTIDDIRVIDSAGQPELLIVYDDGGMADRVRYKGDGRIVREETLVSPDEAITGAITRGSKLHLLTGENGVSRTSLSYAFNGSEHALVKEKKLTALKATRGSSVLLFDGDPLTDPDAQLVSRLDAGPWTSAFSLDSGKAEVVSERYQGATQGLGDGQTITVENTPASTGGGLANQVSSDLSLRFEDAPVGEVVAQLSIEPRSGSYDRAVRPTMTLNGRGDIFYRTSEEPNWTPYASEPPVITADTVLYGVAQLDGRTYSNVVKVAYQFTEEPAVQDSNGDGLPDFVAAANGLDPLAMEADSDGDGFTDFEEVLAETNPLDPGENPTRADTAFEYPNSFNLAAAPAIPDPGLPSTLLRSFPEDGFSRSTSMTVHQPNGFYLGGAQTNDVPSLSAPAALFSALDVVDSELFVIATTEGNFPVNDGIARDFGRQVGAIVPVPEQSFEPFVYEDFGMHGGLDDIKAEAAAWRAAALAYYESLERMTTTADSVGPKSTLVLLLTEKILGDLLLERGLTDRSNISLTPFRSNENPLAPGENEAEPSGRDRSVAIQDLLALQRKTESTPSYKIKEIISTVEEAVSSASTANVQQLVELTTRLYTTSATNAEAGSLRQPFDALRRFIRSGNLDQTGYDKSPASAQFPASLLTEAGQGIAEIEALIPERTVRTLTFYYDGSPSGSDCEVWREVFYSTPGSFDPDNPTLLGPAYALIDDQGQPFPLARAFPLTAGSVFEVTGFVEEDTSCGDLALEVIPQPELVFLRNASPGDADGDLIPDGVQNLVGDESLAPFSDADGDGYGDLQEILSASDPVDSNTIPMENGTPAPAFDLSPPQLEIADNGAGASTISFNFPEEFVPHVEFQLYSSADLQQFDRTGLAASHTGGGRHEITITQAEDAEFYIFRMSLK